jgi:hypothetical protein
MSNVDSEMSIKYASLRIREETRDQFMVYLSQLIGVRKDASLTQEDGVVELLKCAEKVLEEERSRQKGNGKN